ncbi:heavy-metal-associated domain-containing protein [Undibacterium sp.]|jgi:copper chaperone|uniref:heavy-metal-associated domain-containing protein n=1 Tax=Undibacterium sp. TaxID=1914977 RepID=UPI002BE451B9|nr:heavy-metal-associated domain-containing protein [Undibacterium sp.]HTD04142.1 heavy-metal-associated domain-containing protein [Undibacterium sp.]
MVVLQVEEMSCSHCASMVTKAVRSVDSAARVDIDLANKKVQIESQADVAEIADAINDAGYPVTSSKVV